MTNIMAFGVEHLGSRSVYACSDSQITYGGEKRNVQKLFLRNRNLVVGSGKGRRMAETIDSLEIDESAEPKSICEKIVESGRGKFHDNKDVQTYTVLGIEDGQPVIYSVVLNRQVYNRKGDAQPYRKVNSDFSGTGGSQTIPRIKQDVVAGNINLYDEQEALCFCFSFGGKARAEMTVDDKLQIGIVTSEATRLLYHPETNFRSTEDYLDYFNSNIGTKFTPEDLKRGEVVEGLGHTHALFNDLYQAIFIKSRQMEADDIAANMAYTLSKVDGARRALHDDDRLANLAKRDGKKEELKELTDAWFSGDPENIKRAVAKHAKRRVEEYASAIEFLKKLEK